ncbi:hypothetical protein G4Z16_01510 [Streptomyces bathyalis]|uniref:Uncharacterized protein n=1 Tax=Streptomyces bathyalis TaxID=2710756 RepID=A0A7T1T2N1_9ACTN|nr:hypothetical protein [Streptomyces bathyalis]QPP05281.1 hypothetical protein G4Z16_01510 [Streptomyces bathyalis]
MASPSTTAAITLMKGSGERCVLVLGFVWGPHDQYERQGGQDRVDRAGQGDQRPHQMLSPQPHEALGDLGPQSAVFLAVPLV